MMAVLSVGALTSCEDDYEDASSPHVYGESENPPLKGSDATNLVSSSVRMKQADAGTEVMTIDLSQYSDKVQELLGMSLDQAISGINDGSVRFLPVNPNRRLWDKTAANDGDNTWALSSGGVVTDVDNASATMQFVPSSKQVQIKLTEKAAAGIIPVTFGFVKTDDSAYSNNIRIQALVNVVDASVVDVDITVPTGAFAYGEFHFSEIKSNINFAFGETDLKSLSSGLDQDNKGYDCYIMGSDGSLNQGSDASNPYSANAPGFWLNLDNEIVYWANDTKAFFVEPHFWDDDANDYSSDPVINVGRLSSDTPAPGTKHSVSYVIKKHNASDTDKALTINFNITFE